LFWLLKVRIFAITKIFNSAPIPALESVLMEALGGGLSWGASLVRW
jgi:3-oxoacyl-[acyl-carrier-protein] synthase III